MTPTCRHCDPLDLKACMVFPAAPTAAAATAACGGPTGKAADAATAAGVLKCEAAASRREASGSALWWAVACCGMR